jgi:hypothetical protein
MKKKIFTIAASVMLALLLPLSRQAHAQCNVTFPQTPGAGDECVILSTDGCIPAGWPGPWETLNHYGLTDLEMSEWTVFALGCNLMHAQTLMRFDAMSTLPANAVIIHAELRLYGIASSLQNTLGNTWYPGTPFFDNLGQVYTIDGSSSGNWLKNTVTWNTAPAIAGPIMPIRGSVTQWNDNFSIDVTPLTQQIWTNMTSLGLNNNGYLLKLNAVNYYRNTMWASSFRTPPYLAPGLAPAPPPELSIDYYVPDASFTATATSSNSFNFTASNPSTCLSYVWDYGDGSTGTGTSTSHTYGAAGTYTVCLTLKDGSGSTITTHCTTVTVSPVPTSPVHPTGTPSLTMDNAINIMNMTPNPARDEMEVNLSLLQGGKVHYNVYDMQGRLLMQGDNTLGRGMQKMSLRVNKLVPGNYLLELTDNHSTPVKTKFTKE